jgi:hypothetical protein
MMRRKKLVWSDGMLFFMIGKVKYLATGAWWSLHYSGARCVTVGCNAPGFELMTENSHCYILLHVATVHIGMYYLKNADFKLLFTDCGLCFADYW